MRNSNSNSNSKNKNENDNSIDLKKVKMLQMKEGFDNKFEKEKKVF